MNFNTLKVVVRTEVCPIQGFSSWSECEVPINVLLIRETYADQHQDQWALMDTRPVGPPSREQYGLRTKIEERHRLLKCFHDLSDFHSRCFNVIVAQVVFILVAANPNGPGKAHRGGPFRWDRRTESFPFQAG